MVTRLSDLYDYDEPMPEGWQKSLDVISSAGGDKNAVEVEKLKMQIALFTQQATVDLHLDSRAENRARVGREAADELSRRETQAAQERADTELAAAEKRADAAERTATSVLRATWVLALATVGLVVATLVLAFHGA